MKILVISICHNEAAMLPYFIRHYKSFADKIIIVNNHSSDNSMEICEEEKVEIQQLDTSNQHDTLFMTYVKNTLWQKYRNFDWVFVVDIDEIVYHSDMRSLLEQSKDYSVLVPTAYHMMCDEFPTTQGQIYDEIKTGVLSTNEHAQRMFEAATFDKKCIINPKLIIETNYEPGCHHANMTGNVVELSDPNLKLLHYRLLGLDYTLERNKMRAARLSKRNLRWNHGRHYGLDATDLFHKMKSLAIDVI